MSWFVNGPGSAADTVTRSEVFVHHLKVSGKCTMCGNAFNVSFTKEHPDGVFDPVTFECPCRHFVYLPEHNSHRTKDTHLGPESLRELYNLTVQVREVAGV